MNYREKLKLYNSGELNENQRKEIESEIEKQEAISEYIFNRTEIPGLDDMEIGEPIIDADIDESREITRKINKTIRKSFVKTGLISTVIAIIITLFIVFALPDIVSACYYNPAKSIGQDEFGNQTVQYERDFSVYSELSYPELGPSISIGTDSYGYGSYSYYINADYEVGTDEYKTVNNTLTGNIKKNTNVCYNADELQNMAVNNAHFFEEDNLNDFDDSSRLYCAYVSLKDEVDYNDFYHCFMDNPDPAGMNGSWVWCKIKSAGNGIAGFFASNGADCSDYKYDRSTYPGLTNQKKNNEIRSDKEAKQHVLSMLQYLKDNEMFAKMQTDVCLLASDENIEKIRNEGVKIDGFVYVSDIKHIRQLDENNLVKTIHIEEM